MENPIDKKLAQQIVDTVKDVCGQNVNFIDHTGIIYASTDEKRIGSFHEIGKQAAEKGEMMEVDTDSLFAGTQKGGQPAGLSQRFLCGCHRHQRPAGPGAQIRLSG